MKKNIYLAILIVLLTACVSNKSEVEKISVEIPLPLSENDNAIELIEDMTDAVNTCRNNMAIGAKFALEQEKNESDSLTVKQGIKAGIFAAKMMFAARKIEKIRDKAQQLKPEFSDTEWLALKTKMDELEASVGDLNPEDLGLSEEEIIQLKSKEKQRIEEEKNELEVQNETEKDTVALQQNIKDGLALREQEKSIMQSENANNETQQSENSSEESSSPGGIIFIILVFVLIFFGVRRSARRSKRQFKNMSNTFFQAKDQFNKNK